MNFNLIDDPWILVRTLQGEIKEISLREALLNAENYLELAGETDPQNFAVLRLLIAVNLTVMTRFDIQGRPSPLKTADQALERWEQVWNSGKLEKKPLEEYLETVKDAFWLAGEGRRFLQVRQAEQGTLYKASKLLGDLSESSNKRRWFQSREGEQKEKISPSEAARWLINLNAFDDTSAKASANYRNRAKEERISIGAGWLGKLGLIYLKGRNLSETILLNTVLLKAGEDLWEQTQPYWEIENPDVSERRKLFGAPDDLAALLTLPSRRIWLTFEDLKATGYYVTGGDFFEKQNAFSEQFTLWREKESQVFVPRRHQPSRQLWRDFQYFADVLIHQETQSDTDQSKKKKSTVHPPGVIEWIAKLNSQECLPDVPIEICAPAVTYGDKDFFIKDLSSQSVTLFPKILTEAGSEYGSFIQTQIDKLDRLAYAAGRCAGNILMASGSDPEMADAREISVREKIYAQADYPFVSWLSTINPDQIDSDEQLDQLRIDWEEQAQEIGQSAVREFRSQLRPGALIGRIPSEKEKEKRKRSYGSIPEEIERFSRQIHNLYGKKTESQKEEQNGSKEQLSL